MTKKLEGNGLWESSRMILPEYRERILRASAESGRRQPAAVHEDEQMIIGEAIKRSLALRLPVRLKLQGDESRGPVWAEGVVTDASPLQGMVRLESEKGIERIRYTDIVGAEWKGE